MALDHNENTWPLNGAKREGANDGVDVKYDHSGTTTIQIVGTPVTERKQLFEGGTDQKQNKPNENAKVILTTIPTALPDAPPTNDVTTSTFDRNTPARRSKKVTFMDTVTVNEDESAQLPPDTPEEKEAPTEKEVTPKDVEVDFVEDNKTSYSPANESHPLRKQKLKKPKSKSSKSNKSNGTKAQEPQANGAAIVPIVDEFEVHELSKKLSSRDNLYTSAPGASTLAQMDVIDSGNSLQYRNSMSSMQVETGVGDESSLPYKEDKVSNKRKSRRCVLDWKTVMLWIAVFIIVVAAAGIIALAVLYTQQFDTEDNIVRKLEDRLNLHSPSNLDLFVKAHLSSRSESVIYYLPENKDYMPWQKPNHTAVLSWHRGTTLFLYRIRGGQWTRHKLGDPYETSSASPSMEVTPDSWYAADLEDDSDSYALVSTFASDGALGWIQPTDLAAQYEDLARDIRPFNRP